MLNSILNPSIKRSFFLFGARGTGKRTLLTTLFPEGTTTCVDLFDPQFYRLSALDFDAYLKSLPKEIEWVVVDEIQRSPEILNVVHRSLANGSIKFALTGSSARKLKRAGANLLAGRASVFNLFPLLHRELPEEYLFQDLLKWGALPQVVLESDPVEKARILRAYTTTYLREEIAEEQLVRSLEPFQAFLTVAAQMNGKIVNYSNIATDIGVSTNTVQTYFEILSDTLVAIILPAHHTSIRKRQRSNPKIYFFDVGVVESLINSSLSKIGEGKIGEGSYALGNRFEHFLILEIYRLQSYHELDWRFSYLRTKDDAEIDLIIERPNQITLLIEIKSTSKVSERHAASLNRFQGDFDRSEAFLLSMDNVPKDFGAVKCRHWKNWAEEYFPV